MGFPGSNLDDYFPSDLLREATRQIAAAKKVKDIGDLEKLKKAILEFNDLDFVKDLMASESERAELDFINGYQSMLSGYYEDQLKAIEL